MVIATPITEEQFQEVVVFEGREYPVFRRAFGTIHQLVDIQRNGRTLLTNYEHIVGTWEEIEQNRKRLEDVINSILERQDYPYIITLKFPEKCPYR